MKLHLGCGNHKIEGWVNIDGDNSCSPDMIVDLSAKLPFQNNSIEAVVNNHFIEHLTMAEGLSFLKECNRVLYIGSKIRISTPDLDFMIEDYLNSKKDGKVHCYWANESDNDFSSPCDVLNKSMGYPAWTAWGHKYTYNEDDLRKVLTMSGFTNIKRVNYTECSEVFKGCDPNRTNCLVVEASKSI